MTPELKNAIDALRKVNSTSDMSELADAWKLHSRYIGSQNKRGLKIGDMIEWEYRGTVKQGEIVKINPTTTVIKGEFDIKTRISNSLIKGKIEEVA